jgi:hypothetical protein
MTEHAPMPERAEVHHETSDANVRAIFIFGAGLFAVAVAVHVAIWLLFMFFAGREARTVAPRYPLAVSQANRLPPEPRLQIHPRQDLLDLRAGEDAVLNTYGWIDKPTGVARIPIEEAMKLTVQRGLPVRKSGQP